VGSPARLLALYATPSPVSCSRADTEIASDRGGQCRIKESHADQRLELAESCVAVAFFFLSRLRRNAARVTGLAANGPANGQSGRKGRKGHCRRRDCTGTREEAGRGTGREENLEGKKGKMRRQLNGHQKLVRRLALSSRRQT
jgi:hypothetical protein